MAGHAQNNWKGADVNLIEAYTRDKELKDRFLEAINTKAQIDAAIIGKPDRCVLGNWLHGEAERKCQFLKAYKPAVEAHTAFHVQAAKVVKLINGREYDDAQAAVADGSAFAKALLNLGVALAKLKSEAKM
jgi:hypothetical protein